MGMLGEGGNNIAATSGIHPIIRVKAPMMISCSHIY